MTFSFSQFRAAALAVVCWLALTELGAQSEDNPSQDPVEALVEALNVRHIGPGTMSGRVTAIAVPHEAPEVIYACTFHMDGDPSDWRADESVEVLRPERAFEGADLPATPSIVGAIDIRVNELRDPDIFIDNDGTVYMPYSIAGEAGIALAKIG